MNNFTLPSFRNQTNRPSFAHAHLTVSGTGVRIVRPNVTTVNVKREQTEAISRAVKPWRTGLGILSRVVTKENDKLPLTTNGDNLDRTLLSKGGRLTLLVLSTAIVLVAADIGKSGPAASQRAEVREALARYTEAGESMDLTRLMDRYADTPDVSVFSPSAHKAIVGKAMIRKDWADFFNILKKSVRAEPSDLSITTFGDTAIVHYTKIEELDLKNGKTPKPFMRTTLVFWKIGGKWLIEHENYSIPADK